MKSLINFFKNLFSCNVLFKTNYNFIIKIKYSLPKSVLLILVNYISATTIFAVPYHGEPHQFIQPDGSQITVHLYGDEYYIRAETPEGYTVIRDEATGWICYATISEDKTKFVSTGIPFVGAILKNPRLANINLDKHLDISTEARQNIAKANRLRMEGINEIPTTHTVEKRMDIEHSPAPLLNKKENIKGLTILVDFSDAPATVPKSEISDFMNGDNYTGYGNNGSVKQYFHEISGGLLVYENVVFGYFRAPKTFAEYDAMAYTEGIKEIMNLALQWVDNQGFDFSTITTSNGIIQAINIIHTGVPKDWSKGMWFHKSWYGKFFADGVQAGMYNTSPANKPLKMGVVVHENGHMIGGWPDTYKYNDNTGPDGIGKFDLMCDAYAGFGLNPSPPNPYFLYSRGWANIIDVTNSSVIINDSSNSNTIFKYTKSNSEYYLMKARKKVGRSLDIPAEGLTIWHIDETGNNQTTQHQVFLEHANNNILDHFGACWKKGGNEIFNDSTIPSARWYNNATSGLKVWNIGAPGEIMTYRIGDEKFTIDCNGDEGGLAFIDNCKVCAGGNTGIQPNSSCLIYCDAIGNAGTGSDYITLVSYGNVNNITGKDFYSDYTNLIHTFSPCQNIQVTVKLNWAFPLNFSHAWVDWNRNGVFEDTERTNFPAFKNNITSANILVPSDVEGNFTMRIRNVYHFNLPAVGIPCGDFPGEVEDYSIKITKSCVDCNGNIAGTAFIDKCNRCVGGNTGKIECVITSSEDSESNNFITKIFPNPTTDRISIEYSSGKNEDIKIKIVSTVGSVIYAKNHQINQGLNAIPISLATYPQGIYLVEVENQSGKRITQKIVKN